MYKLDDYSIYFARISIFSQYAHKLKTNILIYSSTKFLYACLFPLHLLEHDSRLEKLINFSLSYSVSAKQYENLILEKPSSKNIN